MLARMYISTRQSVMAFAQLMNTSLTPQISTHTKATTFTMTSRWIALTGVFLFGLTFPMAVGSTPDRPIAYQVLVPPLKQAIETAIAEFSRAKSRNTQALPQTRSASTATGNGALGLAVAATL